MADKNKTISFRVPEEDFEELQQYAEELDVSLSEVMRTYTDNLVEDPLYREIHSEMIQQDSDIYQALEQTELDTKWIDSREIRDDEFGEVFLETVKNARRGNYDQAYNIVDQLEEDGLETEAHVLDSVVEKYRK